MRAFTPFYTAPADTGNNIANGPSTLNSTPLVNRTLASGTTLSDSEAAAAAAPTSPSQQQQRNRLVGGGGGAATPGAAPSSTSTMTFSTSTMPMPNHNSNINPNLASQFGTFHLSATTEMAAAQVVMNDRALESITQTLSVLQTIADWRQQPQPAWAEMIDAKDPQQSAQRVANALASVPVHARAEAITTVARAITVPTELAIVSCMEEPFRNEVRDVILQELLSQLTLATNSEPMPHSAVMLAELARRNLVRLSGVAVAVEQFLAQPERRRAGLAVLGLMAENHRDNDGFLSAIQAAKQVEPLLCELYKDSQFEYDVVAITRMLSGSDSSGPSLTGLQRHGELPTPYVRPARAIEYVASTDELAVIYSDRSLFVWGELNPEPGAEQRATGTFGLESVGVPVAVASLPRCERMVTVIHGTRETASASDLGETSRHILDKIFIWERDEKEGWDVKGEIVLWNSARVTAIVGLSPCIVAVAVAWSSQDSCTALGVSHDIAIYDTVTKMRALYLSRAHTDYITALTACEEDPYMLLSGSRDGMMKMWDVRTSFVGGLFPEFSDAHPQEHADCTLVTPKFAVDCGNGERSSGAKGPSTITSLYSLRNFVFSGSLDGSLRVWDTRQLGSPVAMRWFTSPVLSVTALGGGRAAVATARGLFLLSLETMGAIDVVPNVPYTQLTCNRTGSILFAAGSTGVDVFSLTS